MATSPDDLSGVCASLGVTITPELLECALTHRSFAYENNTGSHNERLEFLGDAVLGQAVTEFLYREYPDEPEGTLAKRRASVVSTVALAGIARGLNIGPAIRLGRGEQLTGGADKDSILADTMEALIGASYLSVGSVETAQMVLRVVTPLLAEQKSSAMMGDPKTVLQEYAARHDLAAPEYRITAAGPDHARIFTATVSVGSVEAQGEGTSKKNAEMAAARSAGQILRDRA